jgi:hypothetical protein
MRTSRRAAAAAATAALTTSEAKPATAGLITSDAKPWLCSTCALLNGAETSTCANAKCLLKRSKVGVDVTPGRAAQMKKSRAPPSPAARPPKRSRSSEIASVRTTRHTKHAAIVVADVEAPSLAAPEPEGVSAAEPEPDEPNPDGLSAYELQRLENIRKNNLVLASLDLLDVGRDHEAHSTSATFTYERGHFFQQVDLTGAAARAAARAAKPSQRGVGLKKRGARPRLPTRPRSARLSNMAPEAGMVASERADGTVTLDLGDGKLVEVRKGDEVCETLTRDTAPDLTTEGNRRVSPPS